MRDKTSSLLKKADDSLDMVRRCFESGMSEAVDFHRQQADHYLLLAISLQNETIIKLLWDER
jgi:HEPN domain-containing protein